MTIEQLSQSIGTVPNFYSIGTELEAIARALHAEALSYGIPTPEGRELCVHKQLVRLDKAYGWDVVNRSQEMEEAIYGMMAHIAELAYRRGV